ncbi:MAG: GerMN domain-containing protein [Syntrophomonadaceae bacterium]
MAKRFVFLLISLLLMGMFSGCQQTDKPAPQTAITEDVQLYYGDSENERLVTEKRQVSYNKGEDKYQAVLEELVKGPKNKQYTANIPTNTKVYGTIKEGNKLIIDLSREFTRFNGSVAEILGVGSVVNTMTQFKEIEEVKILVNSEEYIGPSGEPRGFMKTFPTRPDQLQESSVTLYFGNQDATAVVPETRTIKLPSDTSQENFITTVVSELIKGPQTAGLSPTIPKQAKVLSVRIANKIAYVDFSPEMHTKHWRGAAGEAMTINSIVNTLTEYDYISKVKITVAGKPLAIEHIVADEPLPRNEEMIQR